jgi:hypothetical protein
MTQNNLGNAPATLGHRESGTAQLEEAVIAYSAAPQAYSISRRSACADTDRACACVKVSVGLALRAAALRARSGRVTDGTIEVGHVDKTFAAGTLPDRDLPGTKQAREMPARLSGERERGV